MIHQKRKNIMHRRGVLFSGEGDKTQAKWLIYKKNNNNKIGTKKNGPKAPNRHVNEMVSVCKRWRKNETH